MVLGFIPLNVVSTETVAIDYDYCLTIPYQYILTHNEDT